jgi:hypothetical protein
LSFSLAGAASAAAAGYVAGMPTQDAGASHEIILGEEEISDVSLATFYVFDKENVGAFRPGVRLAAGGCSGACGGCAGCGGCGCWTGTYYTDSVFGNDAGPQYRPSRPVHKYTRTLKPALRNP